MNVFQCNLYFLVAMWIVIVQSISLTAEQIPVRHIEGVALGFLALRNAEGEALAYGDWKQVVQPDGVVVDDLRFQFKDGSFYEEITKFTQRTKFHLVSDQVEQRGPSFKRASKSWIDVRSGTITVRTTEKGEKKTTTKHLDLPDDVANGLLFVLLKNVDPSAETTVSFVAASAKPRVVKWNISPGPEKTFKVGFTELKGQHYIVKTKIEGPAGAVAPLVGKQPPDIHVWLVKSEAPTFVEFEGPLAEDNPVWHIQLTAPEPDASVKWGMKNSDQSIQRVRQNKGSDSDIFFSAIAGFIGVDFCCQRCCRASNVDGHRSFKIANSTGGQVAFSLAVLDVNGDGKPDLEVTNRWAGEGVLLGNGDGTFQTAVNYGTGGTWPHTQAESIAVADMNGDGKPDLLVVDAFSATVGVLLGNGNGTFQTPVTYTTGGTGPTSVAVADVNGDGKLDLLVANTCGDPDCNGSVGVLLGNGDGSFQPAVLPAARSGGRVAYSVAVADVNGDGKPDLVLTNEGVTASYVDPNGTVGVLINTTLWPYKAFVQQPINSDGSSIFKSNRGVVPVKFTLTQNNATTCTLPPATISVTRTAGGVIGFVDESSYIMAADNGSNFRIDSPACQYVYNLAASALGVGTYRVDINTNGIVVGHAVFALK